MKFAVLTIFLLLSFSCSAKAQNTFDEVKNWRETREKSFRNARETPLTAEDFSKFKGLEYFDVSEKYVVKARLEKTSEEQVFMMPTNISAPRKYFKYGVLTFELDGAKFSLTVFQSEASAKKNGSLFVPFRDLTNGRETYGAGRYLDIKAPPGDEATLDFNYAYNPACAYGRDDFSCAIPPRENFLQTEIKAGEKIFPHAAKK
jgi:uncharacterized protein (DUF1684 family)